MRKAKILKMLAVLAAAGIMVISLIGCAEMTVEEELSTDTAETVEEKTEFDVVMTSYGTEKIIVIDAVRDITGQGLAEAKATVEGVPSKIKEGVSKEEAEAIKEKLTAVGATVEIK